MILLCQNKRSRHTLILTKMIIRTIAYPRAGLIGNPSDGYFGKTIAFAFRNFSAKIELWESPELELLPSRRDHSVFKSIQGLHDDVRNHGYYGGFRLLKAAAKSFYDYCSERNIRLEDKNFTMRYTSDIPNRVGLAGSSALITAAVRGLMDFYGVSISRHSLANLVLCIENNELGIPAGLQDRVAQSYQGVVLMDFAREKMEARGYGEYLPIEPDKLPPVYVAYREDLSEGTEVYHNDLRVRWQRGETEVLEAMAFWAKLTMEFHDAMERQDRQTMHRLINANFDKRASLYDVGDGNREMIALARSTGASAKFAGSGGAIVGIYDDEVMFEKLENVFASKSIRVIKPVIAPGLASGEKP